MAANGEKKTRVKAIGEVAVTPVPPVEFDPVAASMIVPAPVVDEAEVAPPVEEHAFAGADSVAAVAETEVPEAEVPAIAAPPVPELEVSKPPVHEPVVSEPVASVSVATPTPSVAFVPEPAEKDEKMAEPYTTAADAMKNGAEQMKAKMASQTENAMATGKATMDQVATKSREAMEHSMKSVDEMSGMAKGNVEAMLASSKTATAGIEAIAKQVSDFSRKSFEEVTAAARAMSTVKTPNELMQLQNDFAKTQFDAAVAEMSKLSEAMVKMMGEVFQPMQERATIAGDKMKSMVSQATPK